MLLSQSEKNNLFVNREKRTVLEQKVNETVEQFGMFKYVRHIVVGVSGGADSTALLCLLCEEKKRNHWNTEIVVCHVNHNLRGRESDRDEQFVRKLCEEKEVALRVLSIDAAALAKEAGKSVEENSRNIRYNFFKITAESFGEEKTVIATAHTQDDSLETFFINLARGTGINGLTGIPPVRGNIVRPLIECTREEVEEYCRAQGIDFVSDSSNFTDNYTRNKIRHRIIPGLRELFPQLDSNFGRMERLIRSDAEYLSEQAEKLLKEAKKKEGYNISVLLAAHPAVLGRAILNLLLQYGAEQTEKKVSEVKAVLEGKVNALEPVKDVYFKRKGTLLQVVYKEKEEPYFEWYPVLGEADETRLNSKYFVKVSIIKQERHKNLKKVNSLLYYNCVDYDKINRNISLRQKRPGDKIKINGMTKTLKKILNEKKMGAVLRSALPCAADDQGVFWVYGVGVDQRAAVSETTENMCVFEIWEENENGYGE